MELMMAKQIANSIVKNGAGKHFIDGTEEFKTDMMFAYLDGEIKKYEKFQSKIITNPEAKEIFIKSILLLFKENL